MDIDDVKKDPIDDFLGQCPGTGAPGELRKAIQEKTITVLRRRRWTRRAVWVSGLAACYAAGILTMTFRLPVESKSTLAIAPELEPAEKFVPAPPAPDLANPKPAQQPETALALEWQALDSEERRPELFRLAGEKYLLANDLQSATRCYRSALQGASDEELHITVNDNWLFMSLKEAKLEENRYAKLVSP